MPGKAKVALGRSHYTKFPKTLKVAQKLPSTIYLCLPESAKRNIPTTFRNFWKSSEKIGKCRKVLKTTFQHFKFFLWKSLEVFRGLRMSSEIFGKFRKFQKCWKVILKNIFLKFFWNLRKLLVVFRNLRNSSEKIGKCTKVLKTIFRHFMKIFEDFRKSSEVFGNARKIFECNRRLMKLVYTLPTSDTCGLKIRFKNFDL